MVKHSSDDWPLRPDTPVAALALDHEVTLTHPMVIKIYEYWRACRGVRLMPERRDITPKGMRSFLPYAGLVEAVQTPQRIEYLTRLAGTAIEQVMGPITGKLFSDYLTPEVEARWRVTYDDVRATRGPLSAHGRMAFQGRHWLQIETFIGPLADDGAADSAELTKFLVGFAAWPAQPPDGPYGPA